MTTTKTRTITLQGFLHKSTLKNAIGNASKFVQTYRAYLEHSEAATKLSPILRDIDYGILLPTPGLLKIQEAIVLHLGEVAKQKLLAKSDATEFGTSKDWVAHIYDAKGKLQTRLNQAGEVVELVKDFDDASTADRWANKYLVDGEMNGYAEVVNVKLNVKTRINRNEAIEVIFKKPKSAIHWQRSKTTKSLGFGVKSKAYRASFSRG